MPGKASPPEKQSAPPAPKVTGLALLREPFPANQISKLPKPYKRDSQKGKCDVCGGYHGLPAAHLDYVGHAALTDRLLDADPQWSWEPVAFDAMGLPAIDRDGGLWIKLTVCGVTRYGYGDASNRTGCDGMKERIGDALRNAAMRFGAALDLWHKGELRIDDEPEQRREARSEARNDSKSKAGAQPPLEDGVIPDDEAALLMRDIRTATSMPALKGAFEKGIAAAKKYRDANAIVNFTNAKEAVKKKLEVPQATGQIQRRNSDPGKQAASSTIDQADLPDAGIEYEPGMDDAGQQAALAGQDQTQGGDQ